MWGAYAWRYFRYVGSKVGRCSSVYIYICCTWIRLSVSQSIITFEKAFNKNMRARSESSARENFLLFFLFVALNR